MTNMKDDFYKVSCENISKYYEQITKLESFTNAVTEVLENFDNAVMELIEHPTHPSFNSDCTYKIHNLKSEGLEIYICGAQDLDDIDMQMNDIESLQHVFCFEIEFIDGPLNECLLEIRFKFQYNKTDEKSCIVYEFLYDNSYVTDFIDNTRNTPIEPKNVIINLLKTFMKSEDVERFERFFTKIETVYKKYDT